jgi:hypothetical protein
MSYRNPDPFYSKGLPSFQNPWDFTESRGADSQAFRPHEIYNPDPGPMIDPGSLYRGPDDLEDVFLRNGLSNWDETPFGSRNNEELPFEPEYEQNQYLFEFTSRMYLDSLDRGDEIKTDIGGESNLDQRVQEAYEEIRSPLRDSMAVEEDPWTRQMSDPFSPQDL